MRGGCGDPVWCGVRTSAFSVLCTAVLGAACGRTPAFDDPLTPSEVELAAAPTAIFAFDDGAPCPRAGSEADLSPRDAETVALAELRLLGECSDAGGQWIVGREADTLMDLLFGGHTCDFLDPNPAEGAGGAASVEIGVVWRSPLPITVEGPSGWCIDDADGREPVKTSAAVRAVAFFSSKAAAKAAVRRWSGR